MSNRYRDQKGRYTKSPGRRKLQLVEELYRSFDFFNKYFTNGELPNAVITIQESGRRRAYGWFGSSSWRDRETQDSVPEINISAEWVNRGYEAVLETLLHEMSHLYNYMNDIKDCSSGQYHNKKFKITAEKFGLAVEKTHNKGWAFTSLTDVAKKAIEELSPDESLFKSLNRKRARPILDKKYISLIVDASMEEMLKNTVERSDMSQREVVQAALVSYCNLV